MTTCPTCTRWHEVPERRGIICDRCGQALALVSTRDPIVDELGRVWVGIERLPDNRWRGVEIEALPIADAMLVLRRLSRRELLLVDARRDALAQQAESFDCAAEE